MYEATKRIAKDWEKEHAAHANDYGEEPWGIQWGGPEHLAKICRLISRYVEGQNVLEIGCGGGKWTKALFEMGAKSVTALDVHPVAIAKAQEYEPRATYFQTDGESIPPEVGEGFDLVFTYDVLLHLPPELVFHYMREACRVGKEMILQLPSLDAPDGWVWFMHRANSKEWRHPYELGYFNFYSDSTIATLLELAGWIPAYLGETERDSLWLGLKPSP